MRFLNSKLLVYALISFLIIGIFSCRKPITITNVEIIGPTTVCYGDTGVTYSVAPNPDPQSNDYILWSLPEQAQITSGHGTNTIKVDFGRNAGKIGVKYYSDGEEISEESFLDVNFDVQNKWCRELDFKAGIRTDGVGFSIGNKAYIGTGLGYIGVVKYYDDFWEFDPELKIWTQKADLGGNGANLNLGMQRANAVGFSIGNKGYFGMGTNGSVRQNDFFEFDPTDANLGLDVNGNPLGKWIAKTSVPSPGCTGSVGFSIENKGYIGTGFSGVYLKGFYEYDPSLDNWIAMPDFEGGIRASSIGFSIGNKGYIGTGVTQTSILNGLKDFWVYTK